MFRVPGMYNFAARMCCCIWPTCGKPGKWHKKPNGNIDIGVIKQPCCLCCHIWADTGTHFLLHLRISNLAVPHLVSHNGSPIYWSLWTNSPHPIRSPWTDGPQKFGLHGKMVTHQFVPHGQMVPRIFHLSKGTGTELVGDHLSKGTGTELVGDHLCPGGPTLLGTICPGGYILWGLFVQGNRKWGTGNGGSEVRGSNELGFPTAKLDNSEKRFQT